MNTQRSGAPKFREAWKTVMGNPESRKWAFNSSKPTTTELMRAIDNGPILRVSQANTPPDSYDSESTMDNSRTNSEYIICSCHKVGDEMHLGFALHAAPLNMSSQFLSRYDGALDNRMRVCRAVVGLCEDRLFSFEFTWLVSGALTVRLERWTSSGTRQLVRLSVLAFSPENASALVRSALQPCDAFLDARFEHVLPRPAWHSLEVCDTRVGGMCMFCAIRGWPTCLCPTPMRRRSGCDAEMGVLRARNVLGVWKNFGKILQVVPVATSVVYNITVSKCDASSTSSNVVESGILPLTISTTLKVTVHRCLQLHLDQSGVSDFTATLPPFVIHCDKGAECGQTRQSSEGSPPDSWSSTTSGDCEGIVDVCFPRDIEQSVLMLDLW